MKRLMTLFVMFLLMISIVPYALAENGSDANISNDTLGTDSNNSSGSSDNSVDNSDEGSDDSRSEGKARDKRMNIREERKERLDERAERVEEKRGRMENKSIEIRGRQKTRLDEALAACALRAKNDVDACTRRVQLRLDKVATLAEKDLDRIDRVAEHRLAVLDKLNKLLEGKTYGRFKSGKARDVKDELSEKARAEFKAAREAFNLARENLQTEKKAFLALKAQVKTCEGKTTEDCDKARTDIKLKAKAMTLESLSLMTQHLEKVKATIAENEDVTSEEASAALAAIDAKIVELAQLQAKVEALTEETSKEDIQKLAKQVADLWKLSVRSEAEFRAGFAMAAKIGGLVVRSEKLSAQLDHVLEVAVENGKDTAVVQAQVDSFNSALAEAQTNHERAVALFDEGAKLTGDARAAKIKEAQATLKVSREKLQTAHEILKEITKTLREQKLEMELEIETTE